MYELALTSVDIVAENKQITLVGYEQLSEQLDRLGQYLTSIEVNPENIQESKRLVAQVRKACKNLNERRIAFKKEYLKPLETLEQQVKELDKRAAGFEDTVRVQIREIEEQEREQKREDVEELFNKRLKIYGSGELYPFESFLKQQYLNKSFSMNKIENEMVEWFENRQNDINALIAYSESIPQNKDTVITEYLNSGNVSGTISYFNSLNVVKEKVKKAIDTAPKRANKPQPKTTVLFKISEEDKQKVKQLLEISNIKFEIL